MSDTTRRSGSVESSYSPWRLSVGMASPRRPHGRQDFAFVQDRVAVALLGEEHLAVVGEVELAGVTGDEGIERRGPAVGFGAEDAAESLGFFLSAAERAGHLDQYVR